MSAPLLEVKGLSKSFRLPRASWLQPRAERIAVDRVDFTITAGRSFGVVGESGSGKSTLARLVMALSRPSAGEVRFNGRSLFALSKAQLKATRADFQMVFQDPYGSLDPRMTVERIVAEPLPRSLSRAEKAERVAAGLAAVGLDEAAAGRYPHEFSGGQRQRIAIARALASRPKLVVADEPVSALDVSIQAQVLNLMCDLQRDAGVTYLLISHDLAVVGHVCEEIAVIFHGRFIETGPSDLLLKSPAHPYTRELIEAAPSFDEAPVVEAAAPPFPEATTGCRYAPRCPLAQAACLEAAPQLRPLADGRQVACHLV
ncbi:MAG TPA: oligopeptide/dipeptide ABC transporter ATP-binding protein [Roseiarcus sp.]|nr:oligopeptide/dipeptide ABC transporter ATP-binding protein [Roseiarcus sp.]